MTDPDQEPIEPEDAGDEEGVPADLVELYEVMEWENAVAANEGHDLPHPDVDVPPPNTPGVEQSTPFHSRADWGARPPVCLSTNINPEGSTLHWGGPSPWGSGVDRSTTSRFRRSADHARCPTIVRAWQRFHLDDRGWCDLAYNSAYCPHGHRYDGRGKDVRSAAQGTNSGNLRSYAVVYIAGVGDPLTDDAKRAALDEGRRLAGLRWGHRDWKSTACPGPFVYPWRQAGFPAPAVTPTPTPTPEEEDDVTPLLVRLDDDPQMLVWDGLVRRNVKGKGEADMLVFAGLVRRTDANEPFHFEGGQADVVRRAWEIDRLNQRGPDGFTPDFDWHLARSYSGGPGGNHARGRFLELVELAVNRVLDERGAQT